MTRLAIIADVHGNLPALQAVVREVGPRVDGWICAGDIAGHLPQVDEVVDVLRRLAAICVSGNHDRALVDGLPIDGSSAATRALQVQRRRVSAETWRWLAGLPDHCRIEIDGQPLFVCHGSPRNLLDEKVRTVDAELRELAAGRIVILGNTHRTLCEITETHAILNPGSVGLPVDGDRRASAMILDVNNRTVETIRVHYDATPLASVMQALRYDERYFNCLAEGRWIGFRKTPPAVPVIIAGAAIYGEMVAELIAGRNDLDLVGFVDDAARGTFAGAPILGTLDDLAEIASAQACVDVAVAIGGNDSRAAVAKRVRRAGVRPARLVHPTAVISPTARIGLGCLIDAGAYIGPHCTLAEGVSVWPHAVVSHHTCIGPYASLKPGAVIGGHSRVAAGYKVGLGAVWPAYSAIASDAGDLAP